MTETNDAVSGFRKWLQDNLAPELSRLDERTGSFSVRVEELSKLVVTNQQEINRVWDHLHEFIIPQLIDLHNRIGQLEGGHSGLRKEVMADIKLSFVSIVREFSLTREEARDLLDAAHADDARDESVE